MSVMRDSGHASSTTLLRQVVIWERWVVVLLALLLVTACDTRSSDPATEEDADGSVLATLVLQMKGWGDVSPPSGSYEENSTLTLTATPRAGWFFGGWDGDVSGSDNPLTVTLSGDMSIGATFYQPTPYPNWNGTAVRKILQTFAWGGFPTDEQVAIWAAMHPEAAIVEMLTFEPTNDKLSPPDIDALGEAVQAYIPAGAGQLEGIARYFGADPDGLISPQRRTHFDLESPPAPAFSWDMAARARGFNTFYHRIGFWETNYHMSTNQRAGVAPHPMIRHYDNIMARLTAGVPYDQVVAQGALNSAVAYQYGHNFNVWNSDKDEFRGNEDFAREFHQLFFGILGDVAYGGEAYHENHELVSIKNTAKALTGMAAYYRVLVAGQPGADPDIEVDFDEEIDDHHLPDLMILDTVISGYSAKEKIEALAAVAIEHPESLNNLPIIIITGLADNNLTPERKEAVREMWDSLSEKNLLTFLRQYAVSDLFHSSDRIKYHTTYDRNLFTHNRMQLENEELYRGALGQNPLYDTWEQERIEPFNPVHNVFGQQTSVEAFNDPEVFKNAYNRSTDLIMYYESGLTDGLVVRDWQYTIPSDEEGRWLVKDVARFLWQRFIADGLKNFGPLEEAHLYALLGSQAQTMTMQGLDLGLYLDPEDPERVYMVADLQAEPILSKLVALGEASLALGSTNPATTFFLNTCIQRAIAFISATPYAFLQEGQ